MEELRARREEIQAAISALVEQRKGIYRERRTVAARGNPQRMVELDAKLAEYRICLAGMRREVRIADRIEERVLHRVEPMLAAEEARREILQEMKNGRQKSMRREER